MPGDDMTTVALILGWVFFANAVFTSFTSAIQELAGNPARGDLLALRSAGWAIAAALMWMVAK